MSHPSNLKYLLLSDSLSSLQAIQDPHSNNLIVQRILIHLSTLSSIGSSVAFLWIPGYIHPSEHDAVDKAAKDASMLPKITDSSPSPAYNLKKFYQFLILTSWHNLWKNQSSNKLRLVKDNLFAGLPQPDPLAIKKSLYHVSELVILALPTPTSFSVYLHPPHAITVILTI